MVKAYKHLLSILIVFVFSLRSRNIIDRFMYKRECVFLLPFSSLWYLVCLPPVCTVTWCSWVVLPTVGQSAASTSVLLFSPFVCLQNARNVRLLFPCFSWAPMERNETLHVIPPIRPGHNCCVWPYAAFTHTTIDVACPSVLSWPFLFSSLSILCNIEDLLNYHCIVFLIT